MLLPLPIGFIEAHPKLRKLPVVHVRFDIDISSAATWESEQTLKMASRWVKDGSLKSVTVCPTTGMSDVLEIVRMRAKRAHDGGSMSFREYRGALKRAGGGQGYLKGVERKIVLGTGWESMDAQARMETLKCARGRGPYEPRYKALLDTVRDLHDAFGGELWQDGKMCFKDHVQVAQPFELKVGEPIPQ